jgi:hypothetical protein
VGEVVQQAAVFVWENQVPLASATRLEPKSTRQGKVVFPHQDRRWFNDSVVHGLQTRATKKSLAIHENRSD